MELSNIMPTLVEKRNAAGARWAAAVSELRSAYTDLSALDHLCRAPSFGQPPDPIPLRHSTYLPDLGGTFADDIPAAIVAHSA
jgi:hypothetical protein